VNVCPGRTAAALTCLTICRSLCAAESGVETDDVLFVVSGSTVTLVTVAVFTMGFGDV
jgi:hypothetical protein